VPDSTEALKSALRFYKAGDRSSAAKLCASILASNPQQPEATELLGIIAAQAGHAETLVNSGNTLRRRGRPGEALRHYTQAIDLDPGHLAAHRNRGAVLWDLRRPVEALASYERVLALDPGSAEDHYNRGTALQALGRLEEALQSFDRTLILQPDRAEAHNNRGLALQALGRFAEALQSLDRALELKPDKAQAHYNRGIALQALGRFAEALRSAERTLELRPDKLEAHANRGVALCSLGRPLEALQSYERALQSASDSYGADRAWVYENRAFAKLLSGDLPGGWLDNESRWLAHSGTADPRYPNGTLWLGRDSLAGKTIVVHSEQGLGDSLQFCRYATQLAELGANVILDVQVPLATLLASVKGVAKVVVPGEPLPRFDYHCPLLTLPLALGTKLDTIPADVPYIASDPAKARAWADRLGPREKLRVGLAWGSGHRPDQPETWGPNRRRDVPLAKLAILRNPAISFYSLQKGQPAESELVVLKEGGWAGPDLIDFTASLHDFSDTAGLVANLDLVISVDTSTAHLAGALAKPVWLLNRFDTCWRWLLERTDSPWYPTLRIYRQPQPGDWDAVVEAVRSDLFRLAREDHACFGSRSAQS
jgi:tetratricopeptide (TPR) repeat protein